ncbi:acyloxyacyl hydrolase [Reinekea sp. G2M2-21]|uniref:acyloxyacyl hydrolase n=1 Tax=Reinekea sp. G2M2-21 TaxID=2788942 RepID=UPI0018A89DDF|nr:acyloxyacyl hydrolase [Reinekea sp. G2M2-21]
MQHKPFILFLLTASLIQPVFAFNRESAIAFSVGSLLVWNPMKLDGFGLDFGVDEDFDRTRMLWLWRIAEPIGQWGPVTLQGHYEFAFGQTQPSPQDVSFGLTPVLEWQLPLGQWAPLIETGLGAHYLTRTENQGRQLSTHWQFSEILGVGVRVRSIQAGLRFQHVSNGDIVKPNNGYNFYGFAVKFWY